MTQPSPADDALIDQIAAAIYEWSCQPYKWADAHPDDLLAYRGDAIAVMATVVKPLQERAEKAEAAIERLTSPDAVRAAAFAISDYALTHLGRDLGTIHIEPMAEAGIRTALDDQPKE